MSVEIRWVQASRNGRYLLALTLAACAVPVHAQQFYKWTDASGSTHYSDHAPPAGKVSTVTVAAAPPGTADSAPPVPSATTPGDADPANPAVAARRRACLTARNNLNILQGEDTSIASGPASAAVDAKQRRSAAREQAMNAITANCDASS